MTRTDGCTYNSNSRPRSRIDYSSGHYLDEEHLRETEIKPIMHWGVVLAYMVLLPSLASANNPYIYANENVQCKLHSYRVIIEQPGCQRREVWFNTCIGVCIGSSVPSNTAPYNMVTSCDACKVRETTKSQVELYCKGSSGPFTKLHEVKSAGSCHCSKCN